MKKNYYIAASALLLLMIIAAIYLGERRYNFLNKSLYSQALEDSVNKPQAPVPDKDEPTKTPGDTKDPEEEPKYEEIEGVSFLITEKTMKTTASINVRKGPGTDFPILGSISTNKRVTVTALGDNNWARISFEGQEGFCNVDYLKEE